AGRLSRRNLTASGRTTDTSTHATDNTFDLSLAGQEANSSVVYQKSTDGGTTWATTTAAQSAVADADYLFRAAVSDGAGNSSTSKIGRASGGETVPKAGTATFTQHN